MSMMLFVAFSVVLLVAFPSASSTLTVPLTKLQNSGVPHGVVNGDRARAAILKSRTRPHGPTTVPATSQSYIMYTTRVGIGNPATYYNLMIDTGSSNTFCGIGDPYVRTPTSIPTGEALNITYVSGNVTGLEYLDQVTLAPNLVLKNQSIGDALSSYGFQGLDCDGILGLGPVDRTLNTLSPDTNDTIPTVMNNLVSQGLIQNQVLGVYFAPATNSSDTNGALTYGGADPSLYEGELAYVPVTHTNPASYFWGVNVTSATYGTSMVISNSTAGIVDSGTTLILLADDFFSVYLNAIPGASWNSSFGAIEIPPASIPSMQPLNFTMADQVFTMDTAAQLFPTDENTAFGGDPGVQYGVVSKLGASSGEGFDFVIGMVFLERYYVVFDTDHQRVGFAQTNNTFTTYQG